jgi:hypothetical protein
VCQAGWVAVSASTHEPRSAPLRPAGRVLDRVAPIFHVANLEFTQYEASDDPQAVSAIVSGYEMVIEPERDENQKIVRWSYLAQATSEVSETPEVLDAGQAASLTGAQRQAANAINREIRENWKAERKAKAKAAKSKAANKTPAKAAA